MWLNTYRVCFKSKNSSAGCAALGREGTTRAMFHTSLEAGEILFSCGFVS